MNIYITKKHILHEDTQRPKFAIDFKYNGRQYQSIVLEKNRWDTIKPKQNNQISLRYCTYEDYAALLFIVAFGIAAMLIPWVIASIAELRTCIHHAQQLAFRKKSEQLDSF